MIEVCKLLFDLFFYYTISGFYLHIFTGTPPVIWGMLILAASIIIYVFVQNRLGKGSEAVKPGSKIDLSRIVCCVIPVTLLLFRPTIWQLVQYIPAWGFLGFSIWTGSLHTGKAEFKDHFGFTGKLLLLMLPGFISVGRNGTAFNGSAFDSAVIYLVVYLMLGICLMRMLREEGKLHRGRTLFMLLALFGVSLTLFSLQALDALAAAVGFIYKNIIVNIIFAVVFALGAIFYGIAWIFQKIFSLFGGDSELFEVKIDMSGSAEQIFGPQEFTDNGIPAWLVFLGYAVLALAVCAVVFLIFRRLRGRKPSAEKKSLYTEERENIQAEERRREGGLLRPKDSRLAVRWYYRKFLKEGTRRGAERGAADTSLAVAEKYAPLFPPPDSAEQLRNVYIGARYNENGTVTPEDADRAAALWKKMKKSQVKQL